MIKHGVISSTTLSDVEECDKLLRPEDRRELEDLTGKDAKQSLTMGALLGSPSWALRTHSGSLVALLSVVPLGDGRGIIALSGTTELEKSSTAFLRGSLEVLALLDRRFDTLFNICDARNEVHLRWYSDYVL
jgi:hypothetical protein